MQLKKPSKAPHPFYNSEEWRRVRRQVLHRDNHTCVQCGKKADRMQVDHIYSRKDYPQFALQVTNLRTLCPTCHAHQATSFGRKADYKERPIINYNGYPEGTEW